MEDCMEKVLRKTTALLLSVLMLFSVFAVSGSVSVIQAETQNIYEEGRSVAFYSDPVFEKMDEYCESYDNKANSFDYYTYLGDYLRGSYVTGIIDSGISHDTIGESYVYDMTDNTLFNAAYATWKTSGYVTNPIDAIYDGGGLTRLSYYEAVILKPFHNQGGYARVDITEGGRRRTKLVHRLVAAAFLPLP